MARFNTSSTEQEFTASDEHFLATRGDVRDSMRHVRKAVDDNNFFAVCAAIGAALAVLIAVTALLVAIKAAGGA